WVDQPQSKPLLINGLNKNLEREAIYVESLSVTAHTAQVRFRNTLYDASAQAVGRVARAMALTMPSSVDTFEIVPVSNGLAGAKVTVRRSDLEQLEYTADPAASLLASTVVAPAGMAPRNSTYSTDLYPRFNWALTPWAQTMLFNPAEPLQIIGGASLRAQYELAQGVYLSGSVTQTLLGEFKLNGGGETSLPRVRSRAASYYANGQTDVTTLTIAAYRQLGRELYGRVTVGYLEQMFGGVSTEVLYQPVNSRWALGADLNYVAQRNTDGGFGFDQFNYSILTGHVSGYYDFGNGYDVRVDVGRYLAGDFGGTLTLMRNFSNGWKIGGFVTKTNASAKAFGEGSFDKGIVMQIPLTYFTGKPMRMVRPFVLRPLTRDGGARLQVNDRLRDTLRGTTEDGLTQQWGRFWK
ncbi:MAG: YjbH domain-containing protein, partial [Pseudorhodobacter sp.]|nr:YjbH domain-containing protein [Pseudorhodobacter sp.]